MPATLVRQSDDNASGYNQAAFGRGFVAKLFSLPELAQAADG
jgi:hypothetical protein